MKSLQKLHPKIDQPLVEYSALDVLGDFEILGGTASLPYTSKIFLAIDVITSVRRNAW
jgi:hypothetical protein